MANYTDIAQATTLVSSINASQTTMVVAAAVGYPSTPFFLQVDTGTNVEVVSVTNVTGTTLTIVRGQSTTTGVSHGAGVAVTHVVPAAVFNAPTVYAYPSFLRSAAAVQTMDPLTVNAANSLASGFMYLSFFTSPISLTTTQCRYVVSGAASTSASGTGIGLYSVDGADNGTLIASIASTTLFTSGSINQPLLVSWAASATVTAGSRYALAYLNVAGSGTPTVPSAQLSITSIRAEISSTNTGRTVPAVCAAISGLSALPSSFLATSFTATSTVCWGVIL